VSQRRTLILVAAIVVGALASFLVYNYVNGIEDEAYNNAEQVPVFVVKQKIDKSTTGLEAKAFIEKATAPRKFVPSNAIKSLEDLTGKVALSDLAQNQVVVSDMFVDASDPAAQGSFSERLTRIRNEDQSAITISVDQVRGVAGLINPGDYVNIMLTEVTQLDAEGQPAGVPEDASPEEVLFSQQARYLYQKAEVLAVGQDAVPEPGESASAASAEGGTDAAAEGDRGLITLIVPARAAQYLASAPPESFYLAMVARDYKPVTQGQIDINALLPAEDPTQLTPYGKNGPDSAD
jgi:Flp pilus assembly protein CpaB